MKYLRLFLCLVVFSLTACMSHVFIDTTTRLQVENKTDVTILGLDIISEDGTSVQPWIRDAIEPGEKSRVVEEDWVGTFRVRVRFDKWNGVHSFNGSACATETRVVVALAKQSEADVKHEVDDGCKQEGRVEMTFAEVELDFEGGSQYLVVSEDEDGKAVFKLR
jgi:hypothetical protein